MRVYTVRKQGPNTDQEFQAYIDLLEEIGIDITNVPRTPEPGTPQRWLYVWRDRAQAGRFARELGVRLRDPSWTVHELEAPTEERGSLAPLTILSIPRVGETLFHLEPSSQQRILAHFPNGRVTAEVTFPTPVRQDYERQHGPVWNQVILLLTGIAEDAIARLGGIRIVDLGGRSLYERLPEHTASPRD